MSSRFNFSAAVDNLPAIAACDLTLTFDGGRVGARTVQGRLLKAGDPRGTAEIALRILAMDADVLAVQEVERVEILRDFNREQLGGPCRRVALSAGLGPDCATPASTVARAMAAMAATTTRPG